MRLTWAEYLRLEPPEGLRFEFEAGRLLVSPTGNTPHNALIAVLLERLGAYERRTRNRHCVSLGPHSFFMPPDERDYQPDVGIITDARKDGPLAPLTRGAPNIAVEIASPSTVSRDRGVKAVRYFEEGTQESWRFDAEARTAELLRRGRKGWVRVTVEGGRYVTPLLPGFVLDLGALWRRLDEKLRRR